MKRELLQNVKVQPYTSGNPIDRKGFLSAVLGCSISTAGDLKITVTHSDDGTEFKPVTDVKVFPESTATNGVLSLEGIAADTTVDIDIDLLGLKNIVKAEIAGTAATNATFAIVLGDKNNQPV